MCRVSRPRPVVQSGLMRPDQQVPPDGRLLVHLCGPGDWRAARHAGVVAAESLRDAGFIHLSTQAQAHLPANRLFAGRTDLLVLYVDPGRLADPVRWEPGTPADPPSMLFPHLFGPLPLSAVVAVAEYPMRPDGSFAPLIHNLDG